MRVFNVLISAVLLPSLGLAYPAEAPVAAISKPKARFIVEFEDSLDNGIHKRFMDCVDELVLHHQFSHKHFTGMSFSVEDKGDATLQELRSKPGVKNVWRSRKIQKRDVTVPKDPQYIFNPHVETGVQKLHDRNITGQGIVIGMIDSGINANHPALKGKILPGFDYCTNSTFSGGNNDVVGHGTFCASVAIGSSLDLLGVAPDAKLRMYKVSSRCDSSDGNTDEAMILALLRATDDKVDLISISQGSDQPFSLKPISVVVQRVSQHIPILLSASNEGEALYTGMDGAAAEGAIAVGSYETNQLIAWNATLFNNRGESTNFTYVSDGGMVVQSNSSYKIDYIQNLCSLPNSTIVGPGKFIVGKMSSSCKYREVWIAAMNKNYTGLLLLQNQKTLDYPSGSDDTTLNFTIATPDDLLKYLANGSDSTWSLAFNTLQNYQVIPRTDGLEGSMAESSSWGPTFEQGFYPLVSGPGQYVLGAVPSGGYKVQSGTSFSCPYVAGVVALYLSGHKNISSQQVRANLISTAKMSSYKQEKYLQYTMSSTLNSSALDPVVQQGNGYVDLVAFYDSRSSILSAPYLNLNDTNHRVADHVITFQNNGNSTVQYDIIHKSYDVVYAKNNDGMISSTPPKQEPLSNIVLFSMNQTRLGPGEKASFSVSIAAARGLDQSRGPLFSGVFKITGSNGDELNVPYLGLEFNATAWSVWSNSAPLIIGFVDENNQPQFPKLTTNYSGPINTPVVRNLMAYGTTKMWFGLVDVSYNLLSYVYPPVPGQNGYVGDVQAETIKLSGYETHPIPNESPIDFVGPVMKVSPFTFKAFANMSDIPDGEYRLMGRALNIFGNESNFNDWSFQLTEPFSLQILANDSTSNSTSNSTSSQTAATKSRTSKGEASSFNVSAGLLMLQVLLAFF